MIRGNRPARPERPAYSASIHTRVTDKMFEDVFRVSIIREESTGRLIRRALRRELDRLESSGDE